VIKGLVQLKTRITKTASYEDVLNSLEIIIKDIKHRIRLQKQKVEGADEGLCTQVA